MGTRINKQFLLVAATLGVILSVFSAPAQADPVASFTVSATQVVVGESVIATDTSSNPEGKELTYEWESAPFGNPGNATTNGPECLNANCSQVRFTYLGAGEARISLRINWGGPEEYGAVSSTQQLIKVVEASEAPAPILLNGPTTVSLPTVLDVMSPKPNMESSCFQPALRGSEAEICQLYLIKRVGPDPSGFYHYRWRMVVANPGAVEVGFRAWNSRRGAADSQIFTLNVTGNAFRFGDVRQCYWPRLPKFDNEGKVVAGGRQTQSWKTQKVYELRYYSTINSRVVVDLQIRKGRRWVTVERESKQWSPVGFRLSPWTMRYVRAAFGPKYFRSDKPRRRVIYKIQHGKKVLKKGQISKKRRCTHNLLYGNPLPGTEE